MIPQHTPWQRRSHIVTPEMAQRMKALRAAGFSKTKVAQLLGTSCATVCYHEDPASYAKHMVWVKNNYEKTRDRRLEQMRQYYKAKRRTPRITNPSQP
jgi:hypothetical protein